MSRVGAASNAIIDDLFIGAAIEAGLLIMMAITVDLATRLTRRPAWWFIIPLVILVVVSSPGTMMTIEAAREAGWLVLPPLLVSIRPAPDAALDDAFAITSREDGRACAHR